MKNEKQFLYKLRGPISHFQIGHQAVLWHKLQNIPKHWHLRCCEAFFISFDLLNTMFKITDQTDVYCFFLHLGQLKPLSHTQVYKGKDVPFHAMNALGNGGLAPLSLKMGIRRR